MLRIRSRYVFIACLVALGAAGFPSTALTQAPATPVNGPWVVQIEVVDPQTIDHLSNEIDVWSIVPSKGEIIAQVDRHGLEMLQQSGFKATVNQRLTDSLYVPRTEGALGTIPGFPCYRTVEQTESDAVALVAEHPTLATLTDIGDSWVKINGPGAGYDLWLLKLTNSATSGFKPKLYVEGSIHAREYTTAETVMRFAEYMLANYDIDPDVTWLLDEHEIHLLLFANPDGRKQAETGLSWRKNANNNHCANTNTRGIDLNRNFDFFWGCHGGSSTSGCSLTFRGASAGSEPETQSIQTYVETLFPAQRPADLTTPTPDDATGIFLDLHSFGEVVLSPWSFFSGGGSVPNGGQILTFARKYAFYPGYTAQLGSLGLVDGSTKDWSYGTRGVIGHTIEMGTSFFESCGYFENNVFPGNRDALREVAKVARTPFMTPAGPDAVGVAADDSIAAPGEIVPITATLDDTRFVGGEPNQPIQAAEFYVDVPPWDAGATPIAMTAVDGTFNSNVEAASANLDTTGLGDGRHTIFVRGQDDDGNWGTVSAAFLYIVNPATAPRIQGTVRDGATNAPIEATITANSTFSTTSDSGNGSYELLLPEGTYDLVVSANGYASATLENVMANNLDVITENFFLAPEIIVFADDVEAGVNGWTAQAPWAITGSQSNSPANSWTDSPAGNHANNLNISLTSPTFDLTGLSGTTVRFFQRYDLESGFDFGHVEISTDGSTWTEVATVNGTQTTWEELTISVPDLDGGASARLRFRLTSDTSVTNDGWYVDDIEVTAFDPALSSNDIFTDGFESGNIAAWSSSVGTTP